MKPTFQPEVLDQIKTALSPPQKIALIGHTSPDGDALGSTLAFSDLLRQFGHDTRVLYPTSFGSSLEVLPGARETLIARDDPDEAARIIAEATVIICMDFNDAKRLAFLEPNVRESSAFKILIDHHLHPEDFADVTISYPAVSSTCLLLYHLIEALGWLDHLTLEAAECIYTGMMTDTGNFSYNSEDPHIYTTISALLERGVRKDEINDKISRSYSVDKIRLNAYLLDNNLTILPEYKTAIITMSMAEKNKFGYQVGDTEGLVNEPLAAKDIEFSIFLHEMSKYTKISLRSKGDFPVNEFAQKFFNGGGHKNASGAELYDTLSGTLRLVKSAIKLMHP